MSLACEGCVEQSLGVRFRYAVLAFVGCLLIEFPSLNMLQGQEPNQWMAGSLAATQRPQYPLIEDYALHYRRIPNMI